MPSKIFEDQNTSRRAGREQLRCVKAMAAHHNARATNGKKEFRTIRILQHKQFCRYGLAVWNLWGMYISWVEASTPCSRH
jgi:hypothetical protein